MKPKYWAILILGAAVIVVSLIYYVRQPVADLGPIVVHRATKSQSSTISSESQAQISISGWQIYTSKKYGISFMYPQKWELSEREGDLSGSIHDIDVSADIGDSSFTVRVNNKTDFNFSSYSTTGKIVEQAIVGGHMGQRFKYYHDSGHYVEMQDYTIIPVEPYVFEISLYISDSDFKNGNNGAIQKDFDQILRDFIFSKANPLAADPNVTPDGQIIFSATDWGSYKNIKGSMKIDGDSCETNDLQFSSLVDKVNAGDIFWKKINYGSIFYTPNYYNWPPEKFVKNGFCEAGAIQPLYAYPDKLIWEGPCDGSECDIAQKIIEDYYKNLNLKPN